MLYLLLFTNLNVSQEEYVKEDGNTSTRAVVPDGAPSIPLLGLVTLLFGTGFWMADVMGDSIVAEKAKLEPAHSRGSLQSSCYSYRFFGLMVAVPFSSVLYSNFGPYYIILLLSLLPLSILPLVYMLGEVRYAPIASTREQ
jgi:MFS family permease